MGKLKACSDCGKEISKKAKTCPHCGAKNKKKGRLLGFIIVVVIIGIIAGVAGGSGGGGSSSSTKAASTPPPTQAEYDEKGGKLDYRAAMLEDIEEGALLVIEGGIQQMFQDTNALFGTEKNEFSESGYMGDNVWLVFREAPSLIEDDAVKISGLYQGTSKYETVLGAEQKVPLIHVDYYEVIE